MSKLKKNEKKAVESIKTVNNNSQTEVNHNLNKMSNEEIISLVKKKKLGKKYFGDIIPCKLSNDSGYIEFL